MNYNKEQFMIEIAKAFQITGDKNFTHDDLIFIADTMADDCQQYKNLDFTELLNIVNLGARKKLCEFFGLNVATIHSWIQFYLKSDYKKTYDKAKFNPKDELPDLTESAKDEIFKNTIIPTLTSNNLHDASLPVIYDYLAKNGYIDITNGAVKHLSEAKQMIKTDVFKRKAEALNNNDATLNKSIMKEIAFIMIDDYQQNDVRYYAKIIYMRQIDINELETKLKN
jgi:hypothetical protein